MTTKQSGGKITGILALTMEATVGLDVGDWVHVNGDYTVALADGTKPVLGRCSVSNKKSVSTAMSYNAGLDRVPGDVTIEARAVSVETTVSGGVFAAGAPVGITAAGLVGVAADAVNRVGTALMASTAAGQDIDHTVTAA
jgi:hypothetical protein